MPKSVRALIERFKPPVSLNTYGTVFTDTTEFMNITYGDVIAVGGRHYLVMGDEQERRFGTLVVGRRGLTKGEGFLFGSVSSKLVHNAKNCAVWMVQ